jgi:hypothetical protein
MTEKDLNQDFEEPTANEVDSGADELQSKPANPSIGKASAEGEMSEVKSTPAPQPQPENRPNGRSRPPAEAVSNGREALLNIDTYEEAEALLTEQPDLIDQARAVFGSIVPTAGQNEFIDLAIRAAAEDDATTLDSALKTKRRNHLNLTSTESGQLLEFAEENVGKFPVLALYTALLLTDDLTRAEEAALWQQQKGIVLTAEKTLDIDAMALWEAINMPEPPPQTPRPTPKVEPEPVKAETVVEAPKKARPAPPPPPFKVKQKVRRGGPPRAFVAGGFIFLLSLMSCGACLLHNIF